MAIRRLTIAAAALVVLALGASAARHPGKHLDMHTIAAKL